MDHVQVTTFVLAVRDTLAPIVKAYYVMGFLLQIQPFVQEMALVLGPIHVLV